jgi:hypothetical protein
VSDRVLCFSTRAVSIGYSDTTMLDDGQMNIQVYARRSMGEDDMVGELDGPVNVSSLLGDENGEIKIHLIRD